MTPETKQRILEALKTTVVHAEDNAYRAKIQLRGGCYSAADAALADVYIKEATEAKKALDEFKSSM